MESPTLLLRLRIRRSAFHLNFYQMRLRASGAGSARFRLTAKAHRPSCSRTEKKCASAMQAIRSLAANTSSAGTRRDCRPRFQLRFQNWIWSWRSWWHPPAETRRQQQIRRRHGANEVAGDDHQWRFHRGWAADVDADGDLDIVLGAEHRSPTVLRTMAMDLLRRFIRSQEPPDCAALFGPTSMAMAIPMPL